MVAGKEQKMLNIIRQRLFYQIHYSRIAVQEILYQQMEKKNSDQMCTNLMKKAYTNYFDDQIQKNKQM